MFADNRALEETMNKLLSKHKKIYYLLMIIACCSFTATSIGITINCMGLYVKPLSESLHLGLGSITLYITIMSLCSAFFAPVLSILLRKYDIRFIMSLGIILNATTLFLFSQFNSIYLFYLFSILLGIGNCCFSLIPVTLLIGNWFKKKHGLVSGICLSFSGVAGAIFNPIINYFINQLGWQSAFMICAFLIIIVSLPFSIFVIRLHPRQVGLTPYGANSYFIKTETITKSSTKTSMNISFILIIIYAVIVSFTISFNSNMASFATSVPLSSQLGASMISAAMISNVISKVILGCICDRWNAKTANFIMIFISLCGFIGIMFIRTNDTYLAIFYAFLYGFAFASNAAGIPLLIKEIVPEDNYTKFYSLTTVFTSSSYAIGVSMIGFSYDIFLSYQPILFILIILCILNLFILIILSKQKERSISYQN